MVKPLIFWSAATLGGTSLFVAAATVVPRIASYLDAPDVAKLPMFALPLGVWFAAAITVALIVRRRRETAAGIRLTSGWRLFPAWALGLSWWIPIWLPFAGLQPWEDPNLLLLLFIVVACAVIGGCTVLAVTGIDRNSPAASTCAVVSPFFLLLFGLVASANTPRSAELMIPVLLVGIWAGINFGLLTHWAWKGLMRPQTPLCSACGYDLRGLPNETVCPECGRPAVPQPPRRSV